MCLCRATIALTHRAGMSSARRQCNFMSVSTATMTTVHMREERQIQTKSGVNERPSRKGTSHSCCQLLPRVVQLQVELEDPDRESQNFCNEAPPAAPVAGMVMDCSVQTPFTFINPLGRASEGWSKGALCERTRSSVRDLRKATTAAFSVSLKPARCKLGSTSAEGKSPPRL